MDRDRCVTTEHGVVCTVPDGGEPDATVEFHDTTPEFRDLVEQTLRTSEYIEVRDEIDRLLLYET